MFMMFGIFSFQYISRRNLILKKGRFAGFGEFT